ncbi:hypothetical protein ACVKXF_000029 [Curtobacterium sp. PvP017]|nr:MAG: hypothetical protein DI639_03025 [Leifsonia xyli]ROR35906.1 hypothetical protein EDF63_0020 [Curtobacterium sp. JUb34]
MATLRAGPRQGRVPTGTTHLLADAAATGAPGGDTHVRGTSTYGPDMHPHQPASTEHSADRPVEPSP